ncbi:hypothetical protein GCM10023201_41270 [Actinomycetospora corticicola]|uniref:Uncharacterized protein n=1 Tax=Actinomycetospora corticicola TaxID=663602 RepID=A0A7Y9J683_9PSEU|nr:hypothetical protein [Actinomycetospora corticicola]NYD36786.1 hypothetical protein [Actinomycetospora corticicola]
MQGLTPRPAAAVHAPSFSCLYPGPVDDESVGMLYGPDLDGREAFRLTFTEPAAGGRTRAHFEPVPMHQVRALAAEERATDEAAARARAHAFWGRR